MARSGGFGVARSLAAPLFLLLAMLGWLALWNSVLPLQAAYQLLYLTSGNGAFGCL